MRFIFLICLFFVNTNLICQENTFIRTYNLPGMNGGLSLAVMNDGGFVGTGQHADNGSCRIYAYRIDECGNIIWFQLYSSGGGIAIEATNDNGVIIAANGARLLKIDGFGNLEWERGYSSLTGAYGDMTSVIQSFDNKYFAGCSSGKILRLDDYGNIVWSAQVSGKSIHALDEFPNGDLMYFSWDASFGSYWVGRVTKTGILVWENEYLSGSAGDSHSDWAGEALINVNLNQIIIASNSSNNSGDILITSLDYNGNVVKSNAFGSLSNGEFVRSIDITDDGGYIIGGGTYGFNTISTSLLTQTNDVIAENLAGRDILLFKVNSSIDFQWSSVIGCGGSEKAIGVRTNLDNGYTVSAYTDGIFFGANDIDPLFIKTDNLGRVGCQQYSPELTQTLVNLPVISTNNLVSISSTSTSLSNLASDSILPSDYYMCLECSSTPFFTLSDTTLCVGDTTYFINGSNGLVCFQDWYVDGIQITSFYDSIPFVFSTPGMHNILLETNCGNGVIQYELDFYVNNIDLFITNVSDYNGYEISCNGSENGFIETYAISPFPPVNYKWNTILSMNKDQYNLSSGIYNLQLTDNYGCVVDTNIILTEPEAIKFDSIVVAADTCSKCVGMIEFFISSGANIYSYDWSTGNDTCFANGICEGNIEILITDTNQCAITKEIKIYNLKSPDAFFSVSPSLVRFFDQLDNKIIFSDGSEGYSQKITNRYWNFNYDGNFPTTYDAYDSIVEHSYFNLGSYRILLKIETEYNCVDTISKKVNIYDYDIFIPNAFTPGNNDDINNEFKAYAYGIKQYKMEIYSRWGELLFKSENINNGWDGRKEGSSVTSQIGSYIYNIELLNLDNRFFKYVNYFQLLK